MTEQIQSTPFNRPPRIQYPFRPLEIDIPAPPAPQDDHQQGWLMALLPISSILVMGLFYGLIYAGSNQGGSSGWLYALPMVGIGLFTGLISLITYSQQKHDRNLLRIKQLREYHRLLDKKESRLLAARQLQLDLLHQKFKDPRRTYQHVMNYDVSLWERRPVDPDFMTLRMGIGSIPSAVTIKPPDPDLSSPDIRRAFQLYIKYRKLPDAPLLVDLKETNSIGIVGARTKRIITS